MLLFRRRLKRQIAGISALAGRVRADKSEISLFQKSFSRIRFRGYSDTKTRPFS